VASEHCGHGKNGVHRVGHRFCEVISGHMSFGLRWEQTRFDRRLRRYVWDYFCAPLTICIKG